MSQVYLIPYLWFDKEAVAAAKFYTDIFPNSAYISKLTIKDTPSGDCDEVTFSIDGQIFNALNGGPWFKKNPSVSFILNFDSKRFNDAESELKRIWRALKEEGKIMMPLEKYDFSPLFGWVEDKFGVSWQLILSSDDGEERPFVTPSLMFCEEAFGQAEQARNTYLETFTDSQAGLLVRYERPQMEKEKNKLMYSDLRLANLWIAMNDSGWDHGFTFNEGISFLILCQSQEDVDYYFTKLSSSPDSEQCGWCKDRFGLSWQVVPNAFGELMERGNYEQTQAMLKMKKINQDELVRIYYENKKGRSTVRIRTQASIDKVWTYWTDPDHIKNWYFASDDWYVTHVNNQVQVDGQILIGMSAKDGSMDFDFKGRYTKVIEHQTLIIELEDNRKVIVEFENKGDGVEVSETFDHDEGAPGDIQEQGWQAILNQFKKYVEANQ